MFEMKTLTDYSDESLLTEIRRVANEFQGNRLTRTEFDKLSKVHSATLVRRFGSWTEALDRAAINTEIAPRTRSIAREMVINEIKAYAKEFGSPPIIEQIAERLGTHQVTIRRKFGKWHELLHQAGLQPVPQSRRYTDEECFENVVELWTHYGRQPRLHELTCSPSHVSSSAYLYRWGTWRAALKAFIEYTNKLRVDQRDDGSFETEEAEPTDIANLEAKEAKQHKTKRTINLRLRFIVMRRDNFKCKSCGRSPAADPSIILHVDHIKAWANGGETILENLQTLCSVCNIGKSDLE